MGSAHPTKSSAFSALIFATFLVVQDMRIPWLAATPARANILAIASTLLVEFLWEAIGSTHLALGANQV